jgi:prophage antirepressor-like protein
MKDLHVFNFEGHAVRTVIKDGEPLFVLRDVCEVLGLAEPHRVATRIDEDERQQMTVIDSIGRKQETTVVNESGLYCVVLRSDKPQAKEFRKWITKEVLPSIRRTGLYATDELLSDPDLFIKALQQLKEERAAKIVTQKLLEEKTQLLDEKTQQLDESKEWITIKRMAKLNNIDWQTISWKRLKNTSNAMELPVKKIFDANYGNVNIYHIDAWRHEYAHLVPAYEAAC